MNSIRSIIDFSEKKARKIGLQFINIQEIIKVPINGFFILSLVTSKNDLKTSFIGSVKCFTTFMYKNSCGFVCEDFPKENQTLQTRNDL